MLILGTKYVFELVHLKLNTTLSLRKIHDNLDKKILMMDCSAINAEGQSLFFLFDFC